MTPAQAKRRRMPPGERRRQLVEVALELFAERGFGKVDFTDVAERIDVTPNLLYHYFPDGIRKLYLDAVRLACRATASGLDISTSRPLVEKQPANISRYLDHMLAPSSQYLMFRHASADPDPEVHRLTEAARRELVESIALNNLGTRQPPPAVRAALRGYLDFAEAVCGEARAGRLPRGELERLLGRALTAILAAAGADRRV